MSTPRFTRIVGTGKAKVGNPGQNLKFTVIQIFQPLAQQQINGFLGQHTGTDAVLKGFLPLQTILFCQKQRLRCIRHNGGKTAGHFQKPVIFLRRKG